MNDRDLLTGALNRNAFNMRLAEAIGESGKTGSGFALLYVDIDNMKQFSGHNGHLTGDKLLKRFVELVGPMIRNQGSLFRVGGDKFAIILPECGREESVLLSQQICDIARKRIAPPQPVHCGNKHCMGPAKISASIGISLFEQNMSAESLLEKAENKMYDAKFAGKDHVSI